MGFTRWLHAFALVACVVGLAGGQPAPAPVEAPLPGPGVPAANVKPAGRSAVESNDVPPVKPSPARFAVTPFENYSSAKAFDWLVVGAPFEIAEKTEDVLGLEPVGGPLRVGATKVLPEPEPVAELATTLDVQYVVTGWVDRYNWNLRIALTLWKVSGKPATAIVVAEPQRTGDPKLYHQLLGEAMAQMWTKGAGIQIDLDRAARLQRVVATDLYAVNLMSRGVGYMLGV